MEWWLYVVIILSAVSFSLAFAAIISWIKLTCLKKLLKRRHHSTSQHQEEHPDVEWMEIETKLREAAEETSRPDTGRLYVFR